MSATKYCIDCSEPFDIPGVRCAACVEAEELDARDAELAENEEALNDIFVELMEQEVLQRDFEDSCYALDEDHDLDEIFRRAEEQAERYEDFEE